MKGYIVVSTPLCSADTNRDLQAMCDAYHHSFRRRIGAMDCKRSFEIVASLGMDQDTLNHFFAQCDGE